VKAFILDASLALEWVCADASQDALSRRSLFDERVALVPHIWRFEVMNVITTWQRRGDLNQAAAARTLQDLLLLPFATVDEGSPEAIVSLAQRQRLSAYDATYLHVAMITGEPLASLDTALVQAADDVGVTCL